MRTSGAAGRRARARGHGQQRRRREETGDLVHLSRHPFRYRLGLVARGVPGHQEEEEEVDDGQHARHDRGDGRRR